ncbi:MAG: outer membrane beta-barrel protein [Oligoflexia bacterium]|nr:outer membrane beta-barrel protein [Oligoflexia bacterium]
MKRFIGWSGILLFSQFAGANAPSLIGPYLKTDIGVNTKYQYNVYHDFYRAIGDATVSVNPEFTGQTRPSAFYVKGRLKGIYEKFASQTIQDHFDIDGDLKLLINENEEWSGALFGSGKLFSDPSPNERYGRIARMNANGGLRLSKVTGKGRSLDFEGSYALESFNDPNQTGVYSNMLNNQNLEALAQYNNAFLPETNWFLRAKGGMKNYATTTFNNPSYSESLTAKRNSYYGLIESGFVGRLTERSTVDCAVGWLYRQYAASTLDQGTLFAEPVFYMRFVEQVTRRDQLLAGYNYIVSDSYWSDYVLDQEIYLGLGRVMGDQVLVMGRFSYVYKSFSKPIRRDDERITSSIGIRYSINPQLKVTGDFKIDLYSSDAYNTDPSALTNPNGTIVTAPDRPVSYKAGSIGIGIVATY